MTCVWNQQAQVSVNPQSSAMGYQLCRLIGIGYQPSKIRKFCIDQTDQTMNVHQKMSHKFGSLTRFTGNLHGESFYMFYDIWVIWVNYHISLTWIVRPWMGMIPLMKTHDFQVSVVPSHPGQARFRRTTCAGKKAPFLEDIMPVCINYVMYIINIILYILYT